MPTVDIREQTPFFINNCQWAIFSFVTMTELTLEMVARKERQLISSGSCLNYRARINLGIRRRLTPPLGNNRRKLELIHSLLFSLPGSPILYYGFVIGWAITLYLGDRNGVRTPMQWSADKNAGFTRANPERTVLCRSISMPSITTRRSMWRFKKPISPRCFGGCAG